MTIEGVLSKPMSFDPTSANPAPEAPLSGGEALDAVERALLAQLHFSAGAWREGLDVLRAAVAERRGLA
ncbi:MAG TPA: hypothetical protein VMG12_19650, partial [Polyangiaceae bacterium]|nr:hypothetical protein [Polyangiaceae bacterium]